MDAHGVKDKERKKRPKMTQKISRASPPRRSSRGVDLPPPSPEGEVACRSALVCHVVAAAGALSPGCARLACAKVSSGEAVAIKRSAEVFYDAHEAKKVLREIRLLRDFRHPHTH